MDAADQEISDQEDYDIADDFEQEEYFPFDDDTTSPYATGTAMLGGDSSSAQPFQPSSNLPISSTLISNLNQNVLMQQQAGITASSQMTAYQFQVMQSQVLAQEMAMLQQSGGSATSHGLGEIHGAAGVPHLAPSLMPGSGSGWTLFAGSGQSAMGGAGGIGTPATAAASTHASLMAQMHHRPISGWDPTASRDWDAMKASDLCLGRIARDLHSLYTDPIPGIMVHANENDVTRMLALIKGPTGTPYEGGFFQFYLRCPPDYPISNPRVKLLTTGGGTVRFNPNLYANGKVCLSLLGTWAGPQWSPALNISSLLLSIQSLMCEFPYKNEPGFDRVADSNPEVLKYNRVIRHETLRVAVIERVKEALRTPDSSASPSITTTGQKAGAGDQRPDFNTLPGSFRTIILRGFLENDDLYQTIIAREKTGVAGKSAFPVKIWSSVVSKLTPDLSAGISAGASENRKGVFDYDQITQEMADLKCRVELEVGYLDKCQNGNAAEEMDGEVD